ncbi:MAG: dynamin family protein [Anaerolineae bacterium]|nr:dynamin family protein [Anaerolineae bacterium]
MAEVTSEPKLVQDYEAIRKQEYSLITNLLGILPRIDNIGEERIGQVRDAMFHADHPYLMVFVGPFSSGKSSIINALLGAEDFLKIGPIPTTDRISILRWGEEPQHMGTAGGADTVFYPSPLLRKVSLVDTPGLESIFKDHEETTRKFLHRADVVLLTMLATQAMTQKNLDVLKMFKEYGKKVILVISQADLISAEERATVQQYVIDQSRDKLGYELDVWMMSAQLGQEARAGGGFDEAKWKASGLNQIEEYIEKQLNDADRLRQKLQTPLQIVQTVHQGALAAVRQNQTTFDRYRNITDNVAQQLDSQKREQEKTVREISNDVEAHFRDTGDRSKEAIQAIFQFSRALGSLGRGLFELTGLSRIFRRADTPTYMDATFKRYKVFEPINEIPAIVDKLAPRLEGQDMQDIDDLVKYGNKEVNNLPIDMQQKIIGTIQAPASYDRKFLQDIRSELTELEEEARKVETDKLDNTRRNTLIYLAVWEVIMVILGVALISQWNLVDSLAEIPIALIGLIVILTLALLGFAAMPLRGRVIHTEYVNRLLKLQARYTEILTQAADKQIEYGMQLRREAIAPLTRLVDAQARIQDEQLEKLQSAEQEINQIETNLNALGKRKFLGLQL